MKQSPIFSAVAILALSGCAHAPTSLSSERDAIYQALQGTYIGQMSDASDGEFDAEGILHRFTPIEAPQFGDHVLFYEIIVDGGASPASQRKIFAFDDDPDRIQNRMRAFVLSPDQVLEGAGAVDWAALDPDNMQTFPEPCAFQWRAVDGGYQGDVNAANCAFPGRVFKGMIRAEMTYQITGDTFRWNEALYTDALEPIVTTDGLQLAIRQTAAEFE